MKETILIDGYTVTVKQDTHPANPFKELDCEPPTLTFYEGLKSYGDVPDIYDLVGMIPNEKFARGERLKLINELNCSLKEFKEYMRLTGEGVRGTFAYYLAQMQCPAPSSRSWREATDHFEMLEWLCKLAGIPCHYAQSDGYSQGDSALVMAFATPEWVKKVGAPVESLADQCEGACDLYGYWAWGDVYGISSITDPNGEELEDGSVWGFYGSDHETSGLLESAKDSIEYHKRECIKEMREKYEMACRDIITV